MLHLAAFSTGLMSLGLVCAIYSCNILSHPRSWLRSESLAMILLSLLTGLWPLAAATALLGLWTTVSAGGDFGQHWLSMLGMDLVGVATALATVLVFRATVRATYRRLENPLTAAPVLSQPQSPRVDAIAGLFQKGGALG